MALEKYMAELDRIYAPQKQGIQGQLNALDPYYSSVLQGLETTKSRAFEDIVGAANKRGVVYSGAPIEQQNRYVGEKYLPAVAEIEKSKADARAKLLAQLAELDQMRYKEAYSMEQDAVSKARSGGGYSKTSKPSDDDLSYMVMEDAKQWFNTRPWYTQKFLTEKELLPQLQQLYPELSQSKINQLVYSVRRPLESTPRATAGKAIMRGRDIASRVLRRR